MSRARSLPSELPSEEHVHDDGAPSHEHNCMHGRLLRAHDVQQTPQRYAVPVAPRLRGTRRRELSPSLGADDDASGERARKPLRIHVDTSRVDSDPGHSCFSISDKFYNENGIRQAACGWTDLITPQKKQLLTTRLIPQAVGFMSGLLSVDRVQGRLRLGSSTCGYQGGVQVPAWMRDEGVPDADFVVFVTMRPIASSDTIAYSGHCELDQAGRPIAAHFNWAPAEMPRAETDWMASYLSRIALHELTHSLVFSAELISYFPPSHIPPRNLDHGVDANTDPFAHGTYGYYGSGITYMPAPAGQRAHIATPKVTRAVQRHFACDSLRGAQLEDGGGAGTALAHWEMRIFRDEYMVGSASPGKRTFSAITAALFADSGWYDVNESHVEPLPWGFHAGCDFVSRKCSEWTRPGYLCSARSQEACSYDRRSQAYCDLSYSALSGGDAPSGFSPLLDHCPVYRSFRNGDCTESSSYSSWMPAGGQERCEQCRCFEATTAYSHTGCFRRRCLNTSALQVKVGGRWRTCDPQGGVLHLAPYDDDLTGSVTCPPASEMCDLDTELWPRLHAIEPRAGPAAGGMRLTLTGAHFDALQPPVTLTFNTAEGVDNAALNLTILSDTLATAVIPALIGATSFARADVRRTPRPSPRPPPRRTGRARSRAAAPVATPRCAPSGVPSSSRMGADTHTHGPPLLRLQLRTAPARVAGHADRPDQPHRLLVRRVRVRPGLALLCRDRCNLRCRRLVGLRHHARIRARGL